MPNTIRDLYGNNAHKGRDVGIEIELEGSNLSVAHKYWVAHTDSSLRPNPEAIEYVLIQPVAHKEVAKYLSDLQEALEGNEAKLDPSDRCGVHVHVNCQQLTVSQVLCFICTYLVLEEALVKWCGEDREGNLFTLRAKDAEALVAMLITAATNQNFNNFNSEYRYSSINIASLIKFGSLEFRSLRTPKDFSTINTWVNLLMRIKQYAVGFSHPREIIESVSSGGFLKFPYVVLGDMAELIQCKGIGVTVAEGARRVQEISYIDLVYKKKEKPKESLEEPTPSPNPQPTAVRFWYEEDERPTIPPPPSPIVNPPFPSYTAQLRAMQRNVATTGSGPAMPRAFDGVVWGGSSSTRGRT
jgi:hypothetical protein